MNKEKLVYNIEINDSCHSSDFIVSFCLTLCVLSDFL